MHVFAKFGAKRGVEKVGRRVVRHRAPARILVNLRDDQISLGNGALDDSTHMHNRPLALG